MAVEMDAMTVASMENLLVAMLDEPMVDSLEETMVACLAESSESKWGMSEAARTAEWMVAWMDNCRVDMTVAMKVY